MKILDLPIKAKWYEMIEKGIKLEEYRQIKEFWIKRLFENPQLYNLQLLFSSKFKFKHYDAIRFRYGYTKRTMLFKLDSISIGVGKSEWGAPKEKVFILKLGEEIE
ncbi:hypothetical protein [uncultured Bacteroides sp.]|uniref:hypothetical protein n=1 Tax=uncultured Bacteroides sp. TaxID=162156 RepID=UPI002AAAC278|nr:hypothetical protein [uncultured Bacteroides sp.]